MNTVQLFGQTVAVNVRELKSGGSSFNFVSRREFRESNPGMSNAEAKRAFPEFLKSNTSGLSGEVAARMQRREIIPTGISVNKDGTAYTVKFVTPEHRSMQIPKDAARKTAPNRAEITKTLGIAELTALLSAAMAAEAAKSSLTAPPVA